MIEINRDANDLDALDKLPMKQKKWSTLNSWSANVGLQRLT